MRQTIPIAIFLTVAILGISGLFYSVPCHGSTVIAGIGGWNLSGNTSWYGASIRSGFLVSIEFGGMVRADTPPSQLVKGFSYLLLNIPLGPVQLYAGVSPIITVRPSLPVVSFSTSEIYAKTGAQLVFPPLAIFGQGVGTVTIPNGTVSETRLEVGLGLGF